MEMDETALEARGLAGVLQSLRMRPPPCALSGASSEETESPEGSARALEPHVGIRLLQTSPGEVCRRN